MDEKAWLETRRKYSPKWGIISQVPAQWMVAANIKEEKTLTHARVQKRPAVHSTYSHYKQDGCFVDKCYYIVSIVWISNVMVPLIPQEEWKTADI